MTGPQTIRTAQGDPIAMPCLRMGVVLDGMLDVAANRLAARGVCDLFVGRFGDDIRFCSVLKTPNHRGRPVKATRARVEGVQQAVADGLNDAFEVRYFGTDANPLGVPFLPLLTLSHDAHPMTVIEMMIPADLPGTVAILNEVDALLRNTSVRAGYQGLGFGKTDMRYFNEFLLPPAYQQFRAAIMGRFDTSALFFRTGPRANTGGDPVPGITDTGWRTYVGEAFRDRLGSPEALQAHGVVLEVLPQMTVVTAGPAPLWGDVEQGEDLGAYQAAHAFLRPAYAHRMGLVNLAPWSSRDAHMTRQSEGYIDRLLPSQRGGVG